MMVTVSSTKFDCTNNAGEGVNSMPKQSNACRVPVLVDRARYDRMKAYSELTGQTVADLIRQALDDFDEVSITTRLEAVANPQQQQKADVIEFPSNASAAHA